MLTNDSTLAEINAAQWAAYQRLVRMLGATRELLTPEWLEIAESDMDGGELGDAFDAIIQGLALEGGVPDDATLADMKVWIDATPGIDNERWNRFYRTITA